MHDIDTTLELWEQYIAPLGKKPLNQFRRLTQNPLNGFASKFIWQHLIVEATNPRDSSYLCLSDTKKEWGRSQNLAIEIHSGDVQNWPNLQRELTFFTNSLLYGEKFVGTDGKEHWTAPSGRVWGGLPQCYTIEFDVKSADFLKEQFRWCRSPGKKPMDAPLGQVYQHFSRFADFRGITANWSGNKSLHLHILIDSWHVVDRFRLDRRSMRAGFSKHWYDLEQIVRDLLEVPEGIRADSMLRFPEAFRRLPWGTRVIDSPHLLGIPEGTRVPQITLWECLRERRADTANELFHRPEPFLIENQPKAMSRTGIGGTVSPGPLSEEERLHCETKLRAASRRAWGEWPRLYRLEFVQGEWIARFTNSMNDGNPSSIMKEGFQTPFLCGRDAHKVQGRLDRPLGVLIRMWAMEYRGKLKNAQPAISGLARANDNNPAPELHTCWIDPVQGRKLSDLEKQFQEAALTHDIVPSLTGRAIVKAIVENDFTWLKGPEGAGKTRGLMEKHGEIMTAIGAVGHPSMYAFISYEAATEKASEFNDMQERIRGRYHAIVIRSWETEYLEICERLKLMPFTTGTALAEGYSSLWRAVAARHPDALLVLEKRHRAVWTEIGNRWPVFMTQHGLMQAWTTRTHSRRFWHRDFWRAWREVLTLAPKATDQSMADEHDLDHGRSRYDALQKEMGLALAVHDEVSAQNLLEIRKTDVVEWVQALKLASPIWRKAGRTLDKYRAWDDLAEIPVGLTFQNAVQIASQPARAWQEIAVHDSGEYGPSGEYSIYSRAAGNTWMVRERQWWAGLARRVVVTTTELVPTLIADRLKPVTVLGQSGRKRQDRRKAGWTLVELECPHLSRDTVRVTFDRGCTAANVPAVIERFRTTHGADFFVITNKGQGIDQTLSHAGAKGANGLMGRDIAQVMLHMGPDEHEFHEVLNGWLGVDVCIRLAHVDAFNQSAGRNLGFRKRGDDPHHWLVMSVSLWTKIDEILAQYSRYDFRHILRDNEIIEIRRRMVANGSGLI